MLFSKYASFLEQEGKKRSHSHLLSCLITHCKVNSKLLLKNFKECQSFLIFLCLSTIKPIILFILIFSIFLNSDSKKKVIEYSKMKISMISLSKCKLTAFLCLTVKLVFWQCYHMIQNSALLKTLFVFSLFRWHEVLLYFYSSLRTPNKYWASLTVMPPFFTDACLLKHLLLELWNVDKSTSTWVNYFFSYLFFF